MNKLANKIILLTGATSGIGYSLAKKLAQEGAILALCGRSQEKLDALCKELPAQTKKFTRTFCVSSEEDIVSFVRDTESTLGPIDVLINNAGVNPAKARVTEIKTTDLDWMLKINFVAAVIFMREVVKSMEQRKSGHILNINSSSALFSNENVASYSASKAALECATKILRKEVQPAGIAVTSVFPGGVNTEFRNYPRPDYMSPDTVAEAVANLLSLSKDAVVQELVLRPPVEMNFS